MFNLFKMIRMYNKIKKDLNKCPPLLFHPLNELSSVSVDRQEFLIEISKNKKVLHFGFLDSPLLEQKLADNLLLHQQIKQHASFLFGVDIDENSLQKYRETTGDCNNSIVDIEKGIEHPQLINNFDLVLFPEVLEHVPNPGIILNNLRKLCILNDNAKLCITVPNAFSIEGFVAAMNSFEYVHPDHYYYFSPVTLSKLLSDSGYKNINLRLYAHSCMKSAPAITKNGIIALCEP